MILPIKTFPSQILEKRSQKIKKIDKKIRKLAQNMKETLRANFGLGLSAVQVGSLKRMIVIELKRGAPLVLINPEIIKSSKKKEEFEEGCLSLPSLSGLVPRASEVEVKARNLKGKEVKIKANSLFARILQHEIDHLEGILFTQRVEDIKTLKTVSPPYKIVFFGTPGFAVVILRGLIEKTFGISLVITEPDKPAGRKQIKTPPAVKKLAKKYHLLVYQPERIEDCKLEIENLKPDLFILAAYGKILPKEILKIPKYGGLSIHPSLLPKYRGPSPIQFAIKNGEKETGVTIFKMDEKIDHGGILTQEKIAIASDDTAESLSKKLADLGSKLLLETLPLYLEGKIKPKPQDEKKATYTRLLKKEDGYIPISKIKNQKSKRILEEIERKIRAFYPWPKVWTIVNGKRIILHKAHLEKFPISKSKSQTKLVLDVVQKEGKGPMKYEEYLKGNPKII